MLPIKTLERIDRKINFCKEHMKKEPKKYTFMYESMKQLRQLVLLEFQVMNRQLLN